MAIPKVIHYCWFGRNDLPDLAKKCILSWKKFLPDYEIKEWNEDNFDVNQIPYTKEAYENRKFAFVSDYARFYILYHHGGVYFDTDVEILRPMDKIVAAGSYMGCETDIVHESEITVNPGLGMGASPKEPFLWEILQLYGRLNFVKEDGNLNLKTIVEYTTELLRTYGLVDKTGIQTIGGFNIYPKQYFGAEKAELTTLSYSIHHYAGSWMGQRALLKRKIYLFISRNKFLKKLYYVMYKRLKE